MKILIISTLLLISTLSAKLSLNEKFVSAKNIMGLASNYPGVQNIDSMAYGYASNDGHTLSNAAVNFK